MCIFVIFSQQKDFTFCNFHSLKTVHLILIKLTPRSPNCNFPHKCQMSNCTGDYWPESITRLFMFDDLLNLWSTIVMRLSCTHICVYGSLCYATTNTCIHVCVALERLNMIFLKYTKISKAFQDENI